MISFGSRPGGPEGARATGTGDFAELLRLHGNDRVPPEALRVSVPPPPIEATTVLSFHYKDGVLVAGDRRATAGTTAPTR
jgi:proteasome beta subunit